MKPIITRNENRGTWDILEDDVMLFKNNFVRTRQGKFPERWRSSSLFIAINAWFVYSEGEIVVPVSLARNGRTQY